MKNYSIETYQELLGRKLLTVHWQPLADEMLPLLEDIYCNVLYTGKMGTALIPKVGNRRIAGRRRRRLGAGTEVGGKKDLGSRSKGRRSGAGATEGGKYSEQKME